MNHLLRKQDTLLKIKCHHSFQISKNAIYCTNARNMNKSDVKYAMSLPENQSFERVFRKLR